MYLTRIIVYLVCTYLCVCVSTWFESENILTGNASLIAPVISTVLIEEQHNEQQKNQQENCYFLTLFTYNLNMCEIDILRSALSLK